MKYFFLLIIVPSFFSMVSCKKHIKDEDLPLTYSTYFNVQAREDDCVCDVDSVQIFLYSNEKDYYENKNIVESGMIIRGRYITKNFPGENKDFWFRIVKGKASNEREIINNLNSIARKSCENCGSNEMTRFIEVTLWPTPVRLQLNVFDKGTPVKGATVSIYFNERDYTLHQWVDDGEFSSQKLPYFWYKWFNTYISCDSLVKKTDHEGKVIFENFDPREYFFRIVKGPKSNSKTIYKTEGELPNNSNITTVMDVGIE